MANSTYVIQAIATLPWATVTVSDDGTGNDWLVFTDLGDGFNNARLGETFSFGQWSNGTQVFTARVEGVIENLRGSNLNDNLEGNSLGNVIYGDQTAESGSADTISGQGGDDTIYGGGGGDWMGGSGDQDLIYGDDGNDTISGGLGVDTLIGGAGADSLEGGNGNTVADAGDCLSYEGSAAGVRVSLTARQWTTASGGDAEGDRLIGFTDIIGSSRADVLTDTIKTAVEAGENANHFFGGGGRDRLIMGGGDDTAEGGKGDDILRGEDGADLLLGGADNDTLQGGKGQDTLTGGSGADHFEFLQMVWSGKSPSTRDSITDFAGAEGDRIDLSNIDASRSSAGDNAFSFIGAGRFDAGTEGQLQVVATAGGWLVRGEVNGDAKADFSIFVISAQAPGLADFILA